MEENFEQRESRDRKSEMIWEWDWDILKAILQPATLSSDFHILPISQ